MIMGLSLFNLVIWLFKAFSGILTAPIRCPRANSAEERTSSTMAPLCTSFFKSVPDPSPKIVLMPSSIFCRLEYSHWLRKFTLRCLTVQSGNVTITMFLFWLVQLQSIQTAPENSPCQKILLLCVE